MYDEFDDNYELLMDFVRYLNRVGAEGLPNEVDEISGVDVMRFLIAREKGDNN